MFIYSLFRKAELRMVRPIIIYVPLLVRVVMFADVGALQIVVNFIL